jgi:hypothetical protein
MLVMLVSCGRLRRPTPDAGAPPPPVVFIAVPPLPVGDPTLPEWRNLCLGEPRSRYTDWVDVLVITPDHRCFKDKRRASPQIVFDDACNPSTDCGRPIQCPAAGAPLVSNACYR